MSNNMGENIAILLLLLLFLYFSIKMWNKFARPLFFNGVARGRIVQLVQMEDRKNFRVTELPIFAFSTKNGEDIRSSPIFLSPKDRFELDEIYTLNYNEKSPEEFIISSKRYSIFSFPLVIISIILICILIILGVFIKTLLF